MNLSPIVTNEEIEFVRSFIQQHLVLTGSKRALEVLEDWDAFLFKFVRVIPKDYQQVTEGVKSSSTEDLRFAEIKPAVFVENVAL